MSVPSLEFGENGISINWPDGETAPVVMVSGDFLETAIGHINQCHSALVEIAKICERLNEQYAETGENPDMININLIESILVNIESSF